MQSPKLLPFPPRFSSLEAFFHSFAFVGDVASHELHREKPNENRNTSAKAKIRRFMVGDIQSDHVYVRPASVA